MEWPQYQSYFNFSSEVLSRTSSHMCGRWYLPMFLFRDGLLTLMNNASFIHLLRFWSSLPTKLKFSRVMLWPVMLEWSYIGEGALRCSLNPLSKCSWGLSNVYLITREFLWWCPGRHQGPYCRVCLLQPPSVIFESLPSGLTNYKSSWGSVVHKTTAQRMPLP